MSADASGPTSVQSRILRGGAWSSIARILGIGLAFAAVAVVARVLPGQLGSFALIMSLIGFGSIVARAGLDRTAAKLFPGRLLDRQSDPAGLLNGIGKLALICLPLGSLALAAGTLVVFPKVLAETSFANGVLLLTVATATHGLLMILCESLRGMHRGGAASVYDAQWGVCSNGLFILLLFAAKSLSSEVTLHLALQLYATSMLLVLPVAIVSVVRTLRSCRMASPSGDTANSGQLTAENTARSLLTLALPMSFLAIVEFGCANMDVWAGGLILSEESLGLFSAARRLVQLVGLPLMLTNLAIQSSIAECGATDGRDRLERIARNSAAIASPPALIAIAVLILCPVPILDIAFGSGFAAAASLVRVLSIGQLVAVFTGPCGYVLMLTGRHVAALVTTIAVVAAFGGVVLMFDFRLSVFELAILTATMLTIRNLLFLCVARWKCGVWTFPGILTTRPAAC
jgi:O-antigen/teichoic acid export membrane protein